jgi:hypothetical protein
VSSHSRRSFSRPYGRVLPLQTPPTPSPRCRCPIRRAPRPAAPLAPRGAICSTTIARVIRYMRALPFLLPPRARHHTGAKTSLNRTTSRTRSTRRWLASPPTTSRRLPAHRDCSAVYCRHRPTPAPAACLILCVRYLRCEVRFLAAEISCTDIHKGLAKDNVSLGPEISDGERGTILVRRRVSVLPSTTFIASCVRCACDGRSPSPVPLLSPPRAPSASYHSPRSTRA